MQIKTTYHSNGSFTLESNGIKKTFKGNHDSAVRYFRTQLNYLLN